MLYNLVGVVGDEKTLTTPKIML